MGTGTLTTAYRTRRTIRGRVARLSARSLLYILAVAFSFMFMYPLLWTLMSSFKAETEWYNYPPTFLPQKFQGAGNYILVWRAFPRLAKWVQNTLVVVFLNTGGSMITSLLVAYSFARFRYPGRDVLFIITLSTMMLPSEVTLIPRFILFYKLRWIDTLKPLWVPAWFGGGAFSIFLLRQFLMSLPRELDEAALMDGAGFLRILFNVLIPLMKPVLATLAIISFMGNWTNFMEPLIYLNNPAKYTLALGLRNMTQVQSDAREQYTPMMAAMVMSILPTLTIFFAGQKYFVRGLSLTGMREG